MCSKASATFAVVSRSGCCRTCCWGAAAATTVAPARMDEVSSFMMSVTADSLIRILKGERVDTAHCGCEQVKEGMLEKKWSSEQLQRYYVRQLELLV